MDPSAPIDPPHEVTPALPSAPAVASSAAPGSRLSALVEVVFCSGYPTQLILAALLLAVGLPSFDQAGDLSLTYVVVLSLADAGLLLGLVFFFLHLHGESPREVFIGTRALRPEVRLGLLLTPALVGATMLGLALLQSLWPWLRNVPENPLQALIQSPFDAVLFTIVAMVAGGVREELQRAFVLHRFEQHLGGPWIGLAIFSVAFGLGHSLQGWDAAVVTAMLGAFWGAVYVIRRSVVSTVVSHAGFNLAEILIAMTAAATVSSA